MREMKSSLRELNDSATSGVIRNELRVFALLEYDSPTYAPWSKRSIKMALVEISHVQGDTPVTIFHLQDRVNLGNFAELEELAKEAYGYGVRDMVVDLSKTPSMTSIGIRALIVIHRMLSRDRGQHLKLAGATPEISEMLEIAGVTQHIEIFPTVEDAVNSF